MVRKKQDDRDCLIPHLAPRDCRPDHLRSTGMGVAISISGLGSTIRGWAADELWTAPDNMAFTIEASPMPFYSAAAFGIVDAIGLFLFDRVRPIGRRL